MELNYNWLPKNKGIKIEDSEDFVEIKYDGEIKQKYRQPTEKILREGVEEVIADIPKEHEKLFNDIGFMAAKSIRDCVDYMNSNVGHRITRGFDILSRR